MSKLHILFFGLKFIKNVRYYYIGIMFLFLHRHENTDTPAGSQDIQVLMSSFRSHVIKLRVSKKPDKQHLDLLVENDDKNSGGLWNSIAR